MAHVADYLSVTALEERYEGCEDARSSRHLQTIWLLAKGHTIGEVSAMTSFGSRWIEQLLERYNALGPSALGDLRRGNGAGATVLRTELLERLRARLVVPPPDGGVWTSVKVAHWMAASWAWCRLPRSVAGRRCGRSIGRSRSRGRAIPRRRRLRSGTTSKKSGRHRRRGSGAPSRHAGRGFRDR